jgi:hypothetical protein
MDIAGLSTGLGILTFTIFPLAVPALLVVAAPLLLVAVPGLALVGLIASPLWLARAVRRRITHRRGHTGSAAPAARRRPLDARGVPC